MRREVPAQLTDEFPQMQINKERVKKTMHKKTAALAICIAIFTMSAAAQTNTYPWPVNGNVGIGTSSPGTTLDVNGNIWTASAGSGRNSEYDLAGGKFAAGTSIYSYGLICAGNSSATCTGAGGLVVSGSGSNTYGNVYLTGSGNSYFNGGNVGIGSVAPLEQLYLLGGHFGITASTNVNLSFPATDYPVMFASSALTAGGGTTPFNFNGNLILQPRTTANGNIVLATGNPNSNNPIAERMRVDVYGNVGIGTTTPQAKLEINGNLRFTADGSVQTTAWTGTLCGGDYAESVDVTGNRTSYEPGDVLVLDGDNPGKMLKSIEAYSTFVSGIYSTKPGTVGRRQTAAKSADEVPMAVIGIVPAKVSAENGAIKVGDLLVTSYTPGYAMKGTDRSRMLGAVVGKAMGPLESGTGVIEVLVALQ
jgi:hypothetical protein